MSLERLVGVLGCHPSSSHKGVLVLCPSEGLLRSLWGSGHVSLESGGCRARSVGPTPGRGQGDGHGYTGQK